MGIVRNDVERQHVRVLLRKLFNQSFLNGISRVLAESACLSEDEHNKNLVLFCQIRAT